jgi:hypothetical protein
MCLTTTPSGIAVLLIASRVLVNRLCSSAGDVHSQSATSIVHIETSGGKGGQAIFSGGPVWRAEVRWLLGLSSLAAGLSLFGARTDESCAALASAFVVTTDVLTRRRATG